MPQLDGDILFLAAKLGMCRAQRITAHLITASRLMDTGRLLKSGSTEQASSYASALLEFRAALELDKEDLDALEMTAKLAWLLNTPGQLQQTLDAFEKAAHGQREQRPVRYSRALRFQAETLEQRATKAALNSARIKLETALEALDEPDEYDNKVLELALVNEQLAALHLKRGTHTRVAPYLGGADRYYRDAPAPEGPEGTERVRELQRRLRDAETSADEPEEPEEQTDELIRLQPSHVNSDHLPVFESATDAGLPQLVLPPFTGLTVLREDGDWALIGKGHDRLGFTRKINLHTLL